MKDKYNQDKGFFVKAGWYAEEDSKMKDKEKQITKIVKLEIVESVSFKDLKSAYINDMRISKSKPLSEMKTIIDIDCREDYILEALGYSKDSVVLSREEFDKLKHYEWRVTSGVCMTQKEWFDFCNEDSNRRTCLRIEEREKERKETAEKIFSEIYKLLILIRKQDHEDSVPYYSENVEEFDDKLYELAKQFGVEVEE